MPKKTITIYVTAAFAEDDEIVKTAEVLQDKIYDMFDDWEFIKPAKRDTQVSFIISNVPEDGPFGKD